MESWTRHTTENCASSHPVAHDPWRLTPRAASGAGPRWRVARCRETRGVHHVDGHAADRSLPPSCPSRQVLDLNAFGELGSASPVVADAARRHEAALFAFPLELAADTAAADPEALARQLVNPVDGAIVSASFTGDPEAVRWARDDAALLAGAA
jgi:hypothetical protein